MQPGTVEAIAIAPRRGELPSPVDAVTAVTGRGLEGEYHFADAAPGNGGGITLIATEALAGLREDTGIALTHEQSRRNVLTRGVDVNALVGRRFSVGEVECEGVELCEPCRGLERMTEPGVLRGLVHRGGLRADVVRGGDVRVGDPVAAR
jgi:MOSC domain-containing protein YiiM